jgi:hypothetical protein
MNSLSCIHFGSSANVMVFLETGWGKGIESSSAGRRGTCRLWRGVDEVIMEVEQRAKRHFMKREDKALQNLKILQPNAPC